MIKNILQNIRFLAILILSILIRQIWIFSVMERDEGALAIIALQWIKGFSPYVHSLNNAGPLAYLIYALSTYIYGPNIIPIRMVNNILFFLSIIALYVVIKQFLGKKVALYSSLVYGLFMSAPIYEGQLVLTSSLSASFLVFSLYFLFKWSIDYSKKKLFVSSFFLGCASLIKVHLVLGIALLLTIVLVQMRRRKPSIFSKKEIAPNLAITFIGFVVLPLMFFGYFLKIGAIDDIFRIFFELTTTSHLNVPDVPFGITFNVIVQGLPLLILSAYGIVASILMQKRIKNLILYLWFPFAAILAVFPPHFGHRYIYLIAPASVFAGIGLDFTIGAITQRIEHQKINFRLIVSLMLLIIAMISFVPSIYFQSKQYPQYHIYSDGLNFQWIYADADSYQTQISLGEFLQKSTNKDDQVFIHGWGGTIYYLANRMPPSIYVWTVPGVGVDIPEDEYVQLEEKIRQTEFSYIVIFESNLETIRHRIWDPIVEQTLRKYFFIGNIDNAQIFGKFNSLNEYKYFNFIEKLPLAAKTYYADGIEGDLEEDFADEQIFLPVPSKIKILEDERDTILHHPVPNGNSSLSYSLFIPENSALQFGISLDPEVWNKTLSGDGVEFTVCIKTEKNERTNFSCYIDPKNLSEDQKWHDFRLDLEEFADQYAIISLITSPGPEGNARFDWAHWSDPIVLVRNDEGTN